MTVTKEDLLRVALSATGMSMDRWVSLGEEMKSDARMNEIMKENWRDRPRDSEASIREYYRTSGAWFVNTWNHGVGALLSMAAGQRGDLVGWSKKFAGALGAPGGKILDYGGGFFKDSWPLVTAGFKVDVAEVRGPVTAFLKEFVSMAKLEGKVGVVEVDSETPITGTYHGVICFETLEHVLHPVELASHLRDHLRPGGPFAFSVTFGAPEHAPYHVASNAPLGEAGAWAAALERIGFSPYWDDPAGSSIRIWRSNLT